MAKIKKLYHFLFKKHRLKTWGFIIVLLLAYAFCLPRPLFDDPTCMVLEDQDGNLIGARIAKDGQWRFPKSDSIPKKFITAITEFEDRRFYYHPGIDPIGIARAIQQNIANGKIVSGGSTISMQTIRMARKGKPRSFFQKLLEAIMATRMELTYSKDEIMTYYASYAPFGGNVVGLDAASWRYFGKNANRLSWAEAATLAVLPNSPGLIHPGRNRQALKEKRNRLLDRLKVRQEIDEITCSLAKEEPLPQKPLPLPRLAPHLLDRAYFEQVRSQKIKKSKVQTTINRQLQIQSEQIVSRHHKHLSGNGIHNLAAIVIDVETGNILTYIGNVVGAGKEHGEAVDIIKAPRSTGSILKPFLYAMAMQEGTILPESLLPDIPTHLSGYRPKNYHEAYDGMVTARRSLARSLNVPIIHLLQKYGLEKFHFGLQQLGFSSVNKPPSHYGLPLVLGGAEASLWDICNAYSGMARTVNHFHNLSGEYDPVDFRPLNYLSNKVISNTPRSKLLKEPTVLSASACWLTFEAMQEVERPNAVGEWQQFQSSQAVAWKTGTSFGFRDAWAVGVTPRYVIGVWGGNADGEGRPGLVGVLATGPVLFDLFDLVDGGDWFEQPYDEMVQIPVCQQSGFRAVDICKSDSIWVSKSGLRAPPCPFHKLLHFDKTGEWQVNSDCELPGNMMHTPWFVLPPIEEYYFKSKNPSYQSPPEFRSDCKSSTESEAFTMQFIYPKSVTRIYVPVDLDGQLSRTVFKVAHRNPETTIYWHLNDEYIGSTNDFHDLALNPEVGKHKLTLVDENGFRLEQRFEILAKN